MNDSRDGRRLLWLGVAVSLAAPNRAFANVGIPMLGYAWPLGWILLLPVIGLEALVARRVLGADWRSSLRVAGLGNLVSTMVGIPLAWGAVLLLGSVLRPIVSLLPLDLARWAMVPFHAAWIPPFRDLQPWWVPAAGALLCVPFFFASVWIECKVAQRWSSFERSALARWAWRANALTYLLVAAGLAGAAWVGWLRQ